MAFDLAAIVLVGVGAASIGGMGVQVIRYSERPELWERITDLSAEVWPEYNMHGDVLSRYWPELYEQFPEYQFVLYDDEQDDVLAEGQTIPCAWDGAMPTLGPGIDDTIVRAFALHESAGRPDTLCALAAEIPPRHREKRLATVVLAGMTQIARAFGARSLIAPVRPNWKERYPITPIERYVDWTRQDGTAFDPWIRVHLRLGATLGPALPRSMQITGTIAEWEAWTRMHFPESGEYVFPAGLATLRVDSDRDVGVYWEPNVWLVHDLST
jgi:hypothetical protein